MNAKRLNEGTKLVKKVRYPWRFDASSGEPVEFRERVYRDQIWRYERGWYYLTECRIKPDQIGPGKTWEIDE
jgi:hypothetical protein